MIYNHIDASKILPAEAYSIKSSEINNSRFYRSPVPPHYWYPSVTTVTGFAKSSFFVEWRKNPENEKISKHASNRGNELHLIIEQYLKNNEEYKQNKNLLTLSLFNQLKPELHKINNIVVQETCLWSDTLRLAGRVDCIAEYDGVLSIVDFKGSGKEKKEEWISNYFEQASCYALMYQEMVRVPVNQIVIMISSEDGTTQIFKREPRNYLKSLHQTIKNYWKNNNFYEIQEKMELKNGSVV
jgi:genome maintenance exonuclease 1